MNNQGKLRVLTVDDVQINIDLVKAILGSFYDILGATSGAEALEIVKKESPDLILLDIIMPQMDGYEVCRRLKADRDTRNIPVIFVTSKDDLVDEARGLQLGAVDYIAKPVSPPILKARVKNQLVIYHQSRELEQKVKERTAELNETRLEIIRRLGVVSEFKDSDSGTHILRMSRISQMIGEAIGLGTEDSELLLQTAPLHDVGKLYIPDRILLKPGELDDSEWRIMRNHTTFGATIIGIHPSKILKTAREIALYHHENWDGTGYPEELRGADIPLHSRIVKIADVFDSLTRDRPYKKACSLNDAIAIIKENEGIQFDPKLTPALLEILPEIRKFSN